MLAKYSDNTEASQLYYIFVCLFVVVFVW